MRFINVLLTYLLTQQNQCTQPKTPTLASIILTSHPCSSIGDTDRAFVVATASVWNKLPQNIRSATSLPQLNSTQLYCDILAAEQLNR